MFPTYPMSFMIKSAREIRTSIYFEKRKYHHFLLTGNEAYLTKLSVQGKRDAAYSADNICVNYTIEGQVTPGDSRCTVRIFIYM